MTLLVMVVKMVNDGDGDDGGEGDICGSTGCSANNMSRTSSWQ